MYDMCILQVTVYTYVVFFQIDIITYLPSYET